MSIFLEAEDSYKHRFMAFLSSSDHYLLNILFDDSEIDPEEIPFIDLVSDDDAEPESKGWTTVVKEAVASGCNPLVSLTQLYSYIFCFQFSKVFFCCCNQCSIFVQILFGKCWRLNCERYIRLMKVDKGVSASCWENALESIVSALSGLGWYQLCTQNSLSVGVGDILEFTIHDDPHDVSMHTVRFWLW